MTSRQGLGYILLLVEWIVSWALAASVQPGFRRGNRLLLHACKDFLTSTHTGYFRAAHLSRPATAGFTSGLLRQNEFLKMFTR